MSTPANRTPTGSAAARSASLRLVGLPDEKAAPRPTSVRRTGHLAAARPGRAVSGSAVPRRDTVEKVAHLEGATDPRWVLAVRTAQMLEGTMLRPERREQILRTARAMGLTPFDANLIIAIVQDQARRGYEPDYCPTAGEAQLAMIPLPNARQRLEARLTDRKFLRITGIVVTVIVVELMLIRWLFF